jgi:diaminopimelate epimerase
MEIQFYKYQGTGNDFIMIDGESQSVNFTDQQIQSLCDRRFGIGADGVIILRKQQDLDFDMDYFNADGSKSFCGNGSRCAQAFALFLGWISNESTFNAIDGIHQGKRIGDNFATLMGDVKEVEKIEMDYFIHTGSPHYIRYVKDVDSLNVVEEGRLIRNSEKYREEGTNVNFVCEENGYLKVRTYERGVEGETYSCGTGVTAVAISFLNKSRRNLKEVSLLTRGGELKIVLNKINGDTYNNIWLVGPAKQVYKGSFSLDLLGN